MKNTKFSSTLSIRLICYKKSINIDNMSMSRYFYWDFFKTELYNYSFNRVDEVIVFLNVKLRNFPEK